MVLAGGLAACNGPEAPASAEKGEAGSPAQATAVKNTAAPMPGAKKSEPPPAVDLDLLAKAVEAEAKKQEQEIKEGKREAPVMAAPVPMSEAAHDLVEQATEGAAPYESAVPGESAKPGSDEDPAAVGAKNPEAKEAKIAKD